MLAFKGSKFALSAEKHCNKESEGLKAREVFPQKLIIEDEAELGTMLFFDGRSIWFCLQIVNWLQLAIATVQIHAHLLNGSRLSIYP